MSSSFNTFWVIQTALILSIFIISAVIVTSIQVWVNKKAGDFSSEIEDYDPTDIFHHINIVDFLLFLVFGFLFIRTAPTNYLYIKSKYSAVKAWLIFLTPAFAALGLSFLIYCLSNIFLGSQPTDIALSLSGIRTPLLEILPQIFPNFSSFSIVLLTVTGISVYYNAIMAIAIAIWDSVRITISEYYHTTQLEDHSMQLMVVYIASVILLSLIIPPAMLLIFKLFISIKLIALSLLKVLV